MTEKLTKGNISEQATKTWQNYGDMNPREHGGRFLKFEEGEYSTPDHWILVTTQDMEGHEMAEGKDWRYLFQEWHIEPDMVWKDGDPKKGFTEGMQAAADAVGDVDPRDIDDVEWVLPDLVFHAGGPGYDSYASDYWQHVNDEWGISSSRFA